MLATIANTDIFFSDEGRLNPVVFIHGLGGQSTNWAYQRRYFQRDYRVICPDLPGHGASSGRDLSFQRFAAIVIALLDALQLPRYALVGLSTGARVALSVAAARPDAVACVTAINTFVNLTPRDLSTRIAIYDLLLQEDHADSWATVLLREMNVQEDSAIERGFRRAAAASDPIHIRRIFREMAGWDQNDELKNVSCQAQIIRGSLDKFVPSYCTEDLASRLRAVQVDVLEGLGHLPYLEDPIRFNDCLQRFLQAKASW
ncbi:alpha/beta hydrolase [Paraburkholderia sp. C35]|uniref:alpha/beta fold hydrolase n=1 Tax=Paraburkholderia sp. C35 TaxID=2126993 RepID=UPI0013A53CF3|nr:alpha/beta hydrolase [Paraburkholderia sp. C35]